MKHVAFGIEGYVLFKIVYRFEYVAETLGQVRRADVVFEVRSPFVFSAVAVDELFARPRIVLVDFENLL